MEAGLVLSGTEVKSARDGKIQLKDAYGEVTANEAWLVNAHISHYSHGNLMNHEPVRRRKLLLHRSEIVKLQETTRERGLTVLAQYRTLQQSLERAGHDDPLAAIQARLREQPKPGRPG